MGLSEKKRRQEIGQQGRGWQQQGARSAQCGTELGLRLSPKCAGDGLTLGARHARKSTLTYAVAV